MAEMIPGDLAMTSRLIGERDTEECETSEYWQACAELATAMRREYAQGGDTIGTDNMRTLETALWIAYTECRLRELADYDAARRMIQSGE